MADTQATAAGTIVGYFDRYSDAQQAVSGLQEAGFKPNQIGLAARTDADQGYGGSGYGSSSAVGSSAGSTTSATGSTTSSASSTTANAAHKAGEKAEGMWDKLKNFFEGGSAEPYAEEGRKGDMATREITSDDYYDTEDVHGSLSGLSVPEEHSKYFSHRFDNSDNGAVVTVTAAGRETEAQGILEEYGADLGANAANYDYTQNQRSVAGATGAAGTTAAAGATGTTGTAGQQVEGQKRVQLLGEVLRVHKDRINRGEVRVRKEVVTEQQTVQVPVTREELVVERVPVSGERAATGQIGDNSEIRIPLSEERASLDKQTVVREEVNIGKRAVESTRTVEGDVRREELIVDDESRTNAKGTKDDDTKY